MLPGTDPIQWTSRKVTVSMKMNQYGLFLHVHIVNHDRWHIQDVIASTETSQGPVQALADHLFNFCSVITGSPRKRIVHSILSRFHH
jgi:hypothetical protein